MLVLVPMHPLAPRDVEPAYRVEAAAAAAVGCAVARVDVDALLAGETMHAVRMVPVAPPPSEPGAPRRAAVYRGWMLPTPTYAALVEALANRGYLAVTSASQYQAVHELPGTLALLGSHTPRTVVLPVPVCHDPATVAETAAAAFGDAPCIVKDFVKSRKHEWAEACYIPCAADATEVRRVVGTFLDRQGSSLTGGLVLRAFEPFHALGLHPKSGMPLTNEARRVYVDGACVLQVPYWSADEAPAGELPPLTLFADLAAAVPSRFFTLDLAQHADGRWRIVELGDGQVAGLPDGVDPAPLFAALHALDRAA